jgi:hypothetical protein
MGEAFRDDTRSPHCGDRAMTSGGQDDRPVAKGPGSQHKGIIVRPPGVGIVYPFTGVAETTARAAADSLCEHNGDLQADSPNPRRRRDALRRR